ncbi:G-type lectin S-receptor-like serine/threonine-protein kinase At2g19130 [Camellia sinensis]|uniref:G-type lectin S-receptor-like serine/threonine-protein kinase At2g19130 n=1 Tax=Camellia sinensis TaxID=4442 RepID=UPI0010359DAE|nr:G-type lectin S-receptor-like serine/threonine-protein kinase At2g19130 [Camellia sinensis]
MWPYRRDCGSMFACIVLLFVSFNTCHSIGGDTLSAGQNLLVNRTLASQGNIFELGFFTKGTSFNTYLGIWYKNFTDKIIVWVANRDKPLSNPSSSKLEFSEDGNLLLLEDSSKTPIWSTNLMSPIANSTEAVLLDDGNFVLRNSSEPSTVFWQSFDHPTDTWLPGAKLRVDKLTGKTQSLVSWRNSEDPAPGVFSLGIDINPNKTTQFYIEWNMSVRYWSSGAWDGEKFNLAPEMGSNNIFNFSFVSDESESYFTYSLKNSAMLSRFVMEQSGQISQLAWLDGVWDWKILLTQPSKLSEVYAYCGAFGIFNETSSTHCTCLQGFKPLSTEATLLDDWSGGCQAQKNILVRALNGVN